MSDTEEKGWKYFLFKKRFPIWIYIIIMLVCAVAMYIWILDLAG